MSRRASPSPAALATLACCLAVLLAGYAQPLKDGDIWWHLLYGEYSLEHHTLIPDHTAFSWSPADNSTIYCTWLADLVLLLTHRLAGITGLLILRHLVLGLPLLLIALLARRRRLLGHPLTWFSALLALLMSQAGAFCKPEMFTMALMWLTAWNWWMIRETDSRRRCLLFPPVFLVWANTHAGVVFGLVFLVLAVTGETIDAWLGRSRLSRKTRAWLWPCLGASLAALCCTPYAWRYPVELLRSFLPTAANLAYNANVAAYDPPFSGAAASLHLADYGLLALLLMVLAALRAARRPDLSLVLTNLVFAGLYTAMLRTTFYWAPVFAFSLLSLLSPEQARGRGRQGAILALAVCAFLLSGRFLYQARCGMNDRLWMGFGVSEFHPVRAADFIRENLAGLRVANTYGNGAYLAFTLRPPEGVLIDSRNFPFKAWSARLFAAQRGQDVAGLVRDFPADLWCVDIAHIRMAAWFQASPDWDLAFHGPSAAVYVRHAIWRGRPARSAGTGAFRSLGTGKLLINFCLMIKDDQGLERVLERLERERGCPSWRRLAANGRLLARATAAFRAGRPGRALELLGEMDADTALDPSPLHALALLDMARNAWLRDDPAAAWRLSRQALLVQPEDPLALYLAGISGQRAAQATGPAPKEALEQGGLPPGDWRELLRDQDDPARLWAPCLARFLGRAQGAVPAFVQAARALLAGRLAAPPLPALPR